MAEPLRLVNALTPSKRKPSALAVALAATSPKPKPDPKKPKPKPLPGKDDWVKVGSATRNGVDQPTEWGGKSPLRPVGGARRPAAGPNSLKKPKPDVR